MKEQKLKDQVTHVKEYISAMSKKRKIIIGTVLGAAVVLAIVLAVVLNTDRSGYKVLYTNIDASEAANVYQALKEMGANPRLNEKNEVTVPAEEYDIWLLQLAEKGYPQTALSYDVFSENTGMTTTESESQQWRVYQLQERIQATLSRIDGISASVVTITIPETTDNVWDQATNTEKAGASVLLTLASGKTLEPNQVTGIKNLVAAGVPQMEPEDVTVVNAKTSLELQGEGSTNGVTVTQNLEFEQQVQKQIEDNIKRVLSPRYGNDGVVAVAKVTINYDKMMTEQMQLQEKPKDANGEGGGGYVTHTQGQYTQNQAQTIGGIVGEENNTDIPTYGYNAPTDDDGTTYYEWNTDIDYSYIKTQVEKGNAALERATVSVMVDEENLTQARRTELVNLISNSADIAADLVFVSSFGAAPEEVPADDEEQVTLTLWEAIPPWLYYVMAGAVLVIIVLFVVMILARKRAKKAKLAAAKQREEERKRMAEEIAAHKRQLSDAANAGTSANDEAVMKEVRDFAKGNPEITANLLRSWLKEGDS